MLCRFTYSYLSRCVCTRVPVCVYPVCENVCSHAAKILNNSPIWNRTFSLDWHKCRSSTPWPSFSRSKLLTIYYFSKHLANGERQSKYDYCHQIESRIFVIPWRHCECCTSRFWPTFSRLRILKCENLEKADSKRKYSGMTFMEVNVCHRIRFLRSWYSMTLT